MTFTSLIKSRSVCLSTFCPQVVKIITYLHPIPATFYGGQWSGQGVAGVGGGCQGAGQNRGKMVVEVIGGVVRGSFSLIKMHCKYL